MKRVFNSDMVTLPKSKRGDSRYPPTPGPWHYYSGAVWTTPKGCDDGGHGIAIRASGASFEAVPPWQRDRNMQLCAAAPDLLAALRDCAEIIEALQSEDPDDWHAPPCPAVQRAQAAISKAIGEPTP